MICVTEFFQHLSRRRADKMLHNKPFIIAKNANHDGCKHGFASAIYIFFSLKARWYFYSRRKRDWFWNQQLLEELRKAIIKKFRKRKIYSSFTYNIWVINLIDMRRVSKYNEGIRFLFTVDDIFSKYVWAVFWKTKKVT